jgi:hypothetical protein
MHMVRYMFTKGSLSLPDFDDEQECYRVRESCLVGRLIARLQKPRCEVNELGDHRIKRVRFAPAVNSADGEPDQFGSAAVTIETTQLECGSQG